MPKVILLLLATLAALLTGCSTATPIGRIDYANPAATPANRKLLVFLRGAGGSNKIFERHGLVQQVIDRRLPFDMVAPDAHFGYYNEETLGRRIHEDIILPARKQGYREIWLAGTSLGGLGSLMILTEPDFAREIDGVILLSPFLGWGGIIDEIRDAGGVRRWVPGPHTIQDWQRFLWAWIKFYDGQAARQPPIYLIAGDDDFFVDAHELFSQSLPADHIRIIDGGHTYSTLRQAWTVILDQLDSDLRR